MPQVKLRRSDSEKPKPTLLGSILSVILLKRRLGAKNWVLYIAKGLILFRLLHYVFRFDEWHVHNIYENRPYKKKIVDTVNELHPKVVVEIGCGLGEIVSKAKAKARIGIDVDRNALRAARLLNWRKHVTFIDGPLNAVGNIPQSEIDCLIMINWLHNISGPEIVVEMKHLLQQKTVRYLIVDEIFENVEGYKFHHRFREVLRDSFIDRSEVNDQEGIRRIVVLERKQNYN